MNRKIIMLTNDDGIDSEGLYTIYKTLKENERFDNKGCSTG